MPPLIDSASAILSQAEQRVTISAQNIANISTPGYKRRLDFTRALSEGATSVDGQLSNLSKFDFSIGKFIHTGNPGDIAIADAGFFAVRSGDQILYTRRGQFSLDNDGHLATPEGYILQAQGAGDLTLQGPEFTVMEDGAVFQKDRPVAQLQIVEFEDLTVLTSAENGLFAAPAGAAVDMSAPQVRQGEFEASNVSTGDEMIAVMEAVRRAESAQRMVNVYDDLMGRALTAFGQG
jgi:flagellar basal-body rod protein FlgG